MHLEQVAVIYLNGRSKFSDLGFITVLKELSILTYLGTAESSSHFALRFKLSWLNINVPLAKMSHRSVSGVTPEETDFILLHHLPFFMRYLMNHKLTLLFM
jgi:hypothetical protein